MTPLDMCYDLRDALEKLPSKRLISKKYCEGFDVCAVGALALRDGFLQRQFVHGIPTMGHFIVKDAEALEAYLIKKNTGIFSYNLKGIVKVNDEFEGTPEARYIHVLQELNARIAVLEEMTAPASPPALVGAGTVTWA